MSQNYITSYNIKNFKKFNKELIGLIYNDDLGKPFENIYKTDYFSKAKGEWFELFKEQVLKEFSKWFLEYYKVTQFQCDHSWYQIYKKNNFHQLHTHAKTNFTNVFYLQLPGPDSTTSIENQKFTSGEGHLITFPGFYKHESKKNIYEKDKIIISFNSSVEI